MLTSDSKFKVRLVVTPRRVELHAIDCGHREPRGAEITFVSRKLSDLVEIHTEAVELNDGPSPVKPCLRKYVTGI